MDYTKNGKGNATAFRQAIYEGIAGDVKNHIPLIVKRLLTCLGFKSKLHGTKFLQDAITYRYNNANVVRVGMTNDTYVAVANLCKTTTSCVERAIRNAIVNCHTHGSLKSFNDLAQAPIISNEFAPSNSEFICSVVNWLQLEEHARIVRRGR